MFGSPDLAYAMVRIRGEFSKKQLAQRHYTMETKEITTFLSLKKKCSESFLSKIITPCYKNFV